MLPGLASLPEPCQVGYLKLSEPTERILNPRQRLFLCAVHQVNKATLSSGPCSSCRRLYGVNASTGFSRRIRVRQPTLRLPYRDPAEVLTKPPTPRDSRWSVVGDTRWRTRLCFQACLDTRLRRDPCTPAVSTLGPVTTATVLSFNTTFLCSSSTLIICSKVADALTLS